ncbi:MAG: hypothetical protein ACQEQ8_10900 [Pseudomonadota bacterium]
MNELSNSTSVLACPYPNPTRLWLQSRLDALANQFNDIVNGLEGMITYNFTDPESLYAEYQLSGYSAQHIEYFQKEVGYYLHQLIDSYRTVELPPRILYVKDRRISIAAP